MHRYAVAFPRQRSRHSPITASKSHFASEEAILALHSIAALIPDHIGDAAVDTKSIPSLLAVVKGEDVAYAAATRSAACDVISAAAYCEENVSVIMHAGAGDTLVALMIASGSAGNDLVGDAAEVLFKRLINVTGGAVTSSGMQLTPIPVA